MCVFSEGGGTIKIEEEGDYSLFVEEGLIHVEPSSFPDT